MFLRLASCLGPSVLDTCPGPSRLPLVARNRQSVVSGTSPCHVQQRAELIKPFTSWTFSGAPAPSFLGSDCDGRLALGPSRINGSRCVSALPSHLGEPVLPLPACSASSCLHSLSLPLELHVNGHLLRRVPSKIQLHGQYCLHLSVEVFTSVPKSLVCEQVGLEELECWRGRFEEPTLNSS